MNDVYVLNPTDFSIEGMVDEYVSCIWRPSYFDVGDFELYLGASPDMINLLKVNHYLVRKSDISIDSQGKATYKKVMIIKNIELITDIENGDYLTITGRELKYLLHQRIIYNPFNKITEINDTAENACRQLVTENAINAWGIGWQHRVIPNLILGDLAGLSKTVDIQVRLVPLDQGISDICISCEYGWDIYIYDGKYIFTMYEGVDRSYNQTDRPYVVFSNDFENLYNTNYQLFTEDYANLAFVAGQGEGTTRTILLVYDDIPQGLDLYEMSVDARDMTDDNGRIPFNEYMRLLQQRGREKLAQCKHTEGFTGEVLSDVAFKYGVDFDLGDLVTVINEYGISRTVRVVSAIESEDQDGTKLIPQFNI